MYHFTLLHRASSHLLTVFPTEDSPACVTLQADLTTSFNIQARLCQIALYTKWKRAVKLNVEKPSAFLTVAKKRREVITPPYCLKACFLFCSCSWRRFSKARLACRCTSHGFTHWVRPLRMLLLSRLLPLSTSNRPRASSTLSPSISSESLSEVINKLCFQFVSPTETSSGFWGSDVFPPISASRMRRRYWLVAGGRRFLRCVSVLLDIRRPEQESLRRVKHSVRYI